MNSSYFKEIPLEKDQLISMIKDDKEKSGIYYGRYPVRFILIDNFENMRNIVDFIHKEGAEILDLGTLREFQDDGWISTYKLIDIIKELPKDKDYIIVPISEIIRFLNNNEFYSFLTNLIELENDNFASKRRIYIPILGLFSQFKNSFLDKYHRRSEFLFTWKIGNEHKRYNLIFLDFLPNTKDFTIVNTTKDFLDLWQTENISTNILVSSRLLYHLSDKIIPDEVFYPTKIKDTKEYIEKILEINIPIEYKPSEDIFWKTLLENIRQINSFEKFVERHLNLNDFDRVNPLALWLDEDESFTRWIIKAYYSSIDKDCYTKRVFNSITNLSTEEAIKIYYLKIFDEKLNTEFLEERRKILQNTFRNRNLELKFVENELEERINNMPLNEAIKYVTGTTLFEKKWIVENIDNIDTSYLEVIYPELSYYLREINYEDLNPENNWVEEYFKEYRYSRIKNSISLRLKELLQEKNANEGTFYKWYYSFKPIKELIANNEYPRIWIDGLGLEFLPLIVSLLEEERFDVSYRIARVELPSVTDFNNFEGIDRISDLDDFIHKQSSYFYPENLIREIEIIKSIVDRIIKTRENVLILSDHGFTAFANTKFNGKKIIGLKVAEREGRYAEITDEKSIIVAEDEDCFVYSSGQGKKYLIPTQYKFFSEIHKETHGGATPEEVLIPVIYATKVQGPITKEEYDINLLKEEIEIRNPILELKIKPNPQRVSFRVKGKKLSAEFDKNREVYSINLSGYRAGEYTLTIEIGKLKREIEFRIKGGLKEKDLL